MSVKRIIRLGDPVLVNCATCVDKFDDAWLSNLIIDLYDTMNHHDSIGLTAPQIGIPLRVMVMGPNSKRPYIKKLAIINPSFTVIEDDNIGNWESCLSIPGMKGFINRYSVIKCIGVNCNNQPIAEIMDGWQSIIFQHEIDHLDGLTFFNRITDFKKIGFREEIEENYG